MIRSLALAAILGLALGPRLGAQPISPDLLDRPWRAQWIDCAGTSRREFGVYLFRKTFTLAAAPRRFLVHVSADNRYELHVNGSRVLSGPARGDAAHWRFETLDLAPYLKAGANTLAAVVWNFADSAPAAQMSEGTAFIVQGDDAAQTGADTGASWKTLRDPAVSMITGEQTESTGPGERWDASLHPWGWEERGFDDSAWPPARVVSQAAPPGLSDIPSPRMLVPRSIPLMQELPQRAKRVVRALGATAPKGWLSGRAPLRIPPRTSARIIIDQGELTTAYPQLLLSSGRGAKLKLTYAESLWKGDAKGNRDETEGKEIRGYYDEYLADGGVKRLFQPLWWRTFRYLQLDVQTQDEALVLEDLRSLFTAYPLELKARFASDDPALSRIWQVGWRTARLCAHETYMDCPYYEQLQYAGDTRIQGLISLYDSGDDRLLKNAIESLHESRSPEGLTQSRYPSSAPQYIPPFSLAWIGMLHDLWWYRGETDFLRAYLPGARDVLSWYEARLSSSGLLGKLEWWDFVDWSKDFELGVPPQEADGQSAILSLQFVGALRDAADLEGALGSPARAQELRGTAAAVAQAVYKACWDPARQLLADTPKRTHFSQHANILAVLQDAVPAEDQAALLERVMKDSSLAPPSYYFRFFLFRAMKKAGLADEYLAQLGPWQQMLALGLTTWAETPEPARSDCHAWSAHPNFDLLATVAGIEPSAPAFARVEISPHLGGLKHLKAALPHPLGEIQVSYERRGQELTADVTLPAGLSGIFHWAGKQADLHPGRQRLRF